jgi:hypothetical protein
MKLYPSLLLTVALVAPAALSAAVFEGTVRMKMSDGRGNAHEMTYHLKEGLVRIDMQMGEGSAGMIMNMAKQEMIILMPDQHMYMVRPLTEVRNAAERAVQNQDVTLEKTGETAKILGYDCVKYISKSKEGTSEMWVTEQLGQFMGLGSGGGPMGGRSNKQSPAWEKALMGKNFFPLKVITHTNKGKEEFKMEATAIDKGSQPDSLFVPPADFQKFDLGGMMQGLGLPMKR